MKKKPVNMIGAGMASKQKKKNKTDDSLSEDTNLLISEFFN